MFATTMGLDLASGVAWASFGIVPGSFQTTAINRDGTIDMQAGSHPISSTFSFEHPAGREVPDIDVKLPGFPWRPCGCDQNVAASR